MTVRLAVVVLTCNESMHIARALKSVATIASQIFVIDSGSSDGTTEIAEECGAVVLRHEFQNYAKQFDWAIRHFREQPSTTAGAPYV